MPRILIDSDIPYIRGVLEPYAQVSYVKGNLIGPADTACADAMIIRTRTRCDRALLEGSPVKLIATATIGYDHIDRDYCAAAGIEVVTAAGSNARGVLQWAGAALAEICRQRNWRPEEKTIGVVGTGNVGSLVARYAAHWGFGVMCCDPPLQRSGATPAAGERFFALGDIAEKCDIITFHTPLTRSGEDATYHMAGRDFFASLREGTMVMNSSRGEVADTGAMLDAIRSGRIAAAVDTWENEPAISVELLEATMLGTPHIAGYTMQGKANATAMSVRAVARKFGLPPTQWHTPEVPEVTPRMISWKELNNTISAYCDIRGESAALKAAPGKFEEMRNGYTYRKEYF